MRMPFVWRLTLAALCIFGCTLMPTGYFAFSAGAQQKEEKKEEKKDENQETRYLRREFSYSKFQQTMILPDNVNKDKISAKVQHGVLSIDVPKLSEVEIKKAQRLIEIA